MKKITVQYIKGIKVEEGNRYDYLVPECDYGIGSYLCIIDNEEQKQFKIVKLIDVCEVPKSDKCTLSCLRHKTIIGEVTGMERFQKNINENINDRKRKAICEKIRLLTEELSKLE